MRKFKGTPGPWVNVGGRVDSDAPGDLSSIICTIYSVTPGNHKAVNDANANLIAAAPELLEALQWAMTKIGPYTQRTSSNQDYCDQVDKANAAIAKALGG